MTNKKWFPGWGMMRFWESRRFEGAPKHTFATGSDGDGTEGTFPGAINSRSWDYPARDTLQRLSMTSGVLFRRH